MDVFKQEIIRILQKHTKLKDIQLEVPPDPKLGDFAFPCFQLSKTLKKSPADIAEDLSKKIKLSKDFDSVKPTGPYLNFFVNKKALADTTISNVLKSKKKYGIQKDKNLSYIVEYFCANTHKGVHIGHVRNIAMGESLCRILEASGVKVYRVSFTGDIGPHVAKCLWGYLNLKENEPEKHKGIWLGNIYAKANNKSKGSKEIESEINDINNRLYSGDKELKKVWEKTRKYCLDDFKEIFKEFGFKLDRLFLESETEAVGRKVIEQLLKDKIAENSDGAVIVNLEKYNLGVFVVLTSEGNALYSTKDLGLVMLKSKEFPKVDKSLHLVGSEQLHHFKQLFKTLELMDHDFHFKSQHLSTGLVMLPEGKMSSRDGTMVLYEDLKNKLFDISESEIKKRYKDISKEDIKRRARQIAMAALKFSMINREFNKNIIFDWSDALDFEGETGPYVQYAHARICSIKKKFGKTLPKKADFSMLKSPEEQNLIKLVSSYPSVVEDSASNFKPSLISRFLLDISQSFNDFYQKHKVVTEDKALSEARVLLIESVRQVIENGLELLGIDAPERM